MGATSNKHLRALLYGASGVGKSVGAMRLALAITPPDKKVLYLDSGTGFDSFDNHSDIDPSRWVRLSIDRLFKLEGVADLVKAKQGRFGTIGCVIVDEHSSMIDTDLSHIVKSKADNDPSKDPDTPTQPDFNASKARATKYTNYLLEMHNVHLILVSHEKDDKDGDIMRTSPNYNPKLGATIRERMSIVGRMVADQKLSENGEPVFIRSVQVWPTKTVVAKTRIGGMGVTVPFHEMVTRIKEWINGNAETIEKNEVAPTVYEPATSEDD